MNNHSLDASTGENEVYVGVATELHTGRRAMARVGVETLTSDCKSTSQCRRTSTGTVMVIHEGLASEARAHGWLMRWYGARQNEWRECKRNDAPSCGIETVGMSTFVMKLLDDAC